MAENQNISAFIVALVKALKNLVGFNGEKTEATAELYLKTPSLFVCVLLLYNTIKR